MPVRNAFPLHALLLASAMAAGMAVGCKRQDVAVDQVQAVATTPAATSEASPSQIRGMGVVTRILPDDRDGSPHQRFILRLPSGQTLLVAHNIDLAPAISNLQVGDTVEYNGEYAWNPKGGVVHWTHRDPSHQHVDGWLKHDGHVYQ
jgi:hypothetical protein